MVGHAQLTYTVARIGIKPCRPIITQHLVTRLLLQRGVRNLTLILLNIIRGDILLLILLVIQKWVRHVHLMLVSWTSWRSTNKTAGHLHVIIHVLILGHINILLLHVHITRWNLLLLVILLDDISRLLLNI